MVTTTEAEHIAAGMGEGECELVLRLLSQWRGHEDVVLDRIGELHAAAAEDVVSDSVGTETAPAAS